MLSHLLLCVVMSDKVLLYALVFPTLAVVFLLFVLPLSRTAIDDVPCVVSTDSHATSNCNQPKHTSYNVNTLIK